MATTAEQNIAAQLSLRVDQIVAEVTARLGNAVADEEIGAVLRWVGQRFGMTEVIIADIAKAREGRDDVVVFSTADLPRLSFPRLLKHPIARRALAAKEAVSLEEVLHSIGATSAALPRPLREHKALGINVEGEDEQLSVLFAGKDAQSNGLSRSVMTLSAQLAVERRNHVKANPPPRISLTDREAEAMRLLSQGLSDAEIGAVMKIAPRTVRFHVANAKVKLGVTSRAQAVVKTARAPVG